VADFYGGLPGGRAHVILVPVPGERDPGVFGAVLRRGPPSVVLYFGAAAPEASFRGEWVAFHELFHLGNPNNEGRIPWFIEGFTTYYQDVLRARAGVRSAAEMWGDLHDGLRRHCDPVDGVPLLTESRRLRESHRYTRVYWGGACLALFLDVAIREASGNRDSLDQVLLRLRQAGARRPLSEDDIIAALDRAAGRPLCRRHLRSRGKVSLLSLYRRLGIVPTGPETVKLLDQAPLLAIRQAIMAPVDAPAAAK
jgi:hypothetical protein